MKKKIFKVPAMIAFSVMLSAAVLTSCNNSDDYNTETSEDSLHNDATPIDTGSSMMMNTDTMHMHGDSSMRGADSGMMNRSGSAPMDSSHRTPHN